MSAPSAQMTVLAGKRFACIKITGRANFTSSIDFKTAFNDLREKGITYFVLDLSECQLMDSTFLGVLTGFGLNMSRANGDSGIRPIELLNPNARVGELLENVGVIELFKITHGEMSSPEVLEARALEPTSSSHQEMTRNCLEAHKTLMSVSEDNTARFKDVAQFLEEDLRKCKEKQQ